MNCRLWSVDSFVPRPSSLVLRNNGFTLIELMITLVFVALGSMLIQGGLLRSAEIHSRVANTFKVMLWTQEEVAKAKEAFLFERSREEGNENGILEMSNRPFAWSSGIQETGGSVYSIRQNVNWKENGKPVSFGSEWYVYRKETSDF